MNTVETVANGLQGAAEGASRQIRQRDQAQFLAAGDELIEAAGETTRVFEGAPQQVGDKGGHNLDLQGVLTAAQRLFDFEHGLDPFPPLLDLPAFFVQWGDAQGRQIKAIGQHPDQAAIRQLVADDAQQHLRPAGQANRPVTAQPNPALAEPPKAQGGVR